MPYATDNSYVRETNHQSGSLSCVICTDHDGFYLMSHGHEEVQFVLRSSYLGGQSLGSPVFYFTSLTGRGDAVLPLT